MDSSPSVSVIIPTYKRPRHCLRAVKSVLMQSYQDFEVVVGDDHAEDETGMLLRELGDSRIRYFDNEGLGGSASRNRNLCLTRSRGDLVTFLDSDDFMLPQKLERQVRSLDSSPQAQFVVCGTRIVKVHKGEYYQYQDLIPSAEGDLREAYFARKLRCYNTGMMVRRKVFDEIGPWDPAVGPYDDSELIMRLLLNYPGARVKEVCMFWFDHDVDSFSSDLRLRTDGLEHFLCKHQGLWAAYPDWAAFRMKELLKLQFISGRHDAFQRWAAKAPPSVRGSVRAFSRINSNRLLRWLVRTIRRRAARMRRPDWLKSGPVPLGDLVPDGAEGVLQFISDSDYGD